MQKNVSGSPSVFRVQSARTLQAQIEVEGHILNGFIDPGSEISIISLQLFQKLLEKNPLLCLKPTNIKVTVANDSAMVVLGIVPLKCKWLGTGQDFTVTFVVSAKLATDLLIGLDLLESQQSVVDLPHKCLRFCGLDDVVPLERTSASVWTED